MKKNILIHFSASLIFLIMSCSNNSITGDKEAELSGFYEATTFIEPGSHDAR